MADPNNPNVTPPKPTNASSLTDQIKTTNPFTQSLGKVAGTATDQLLHLNPDRPFTKLAAAGSDALGTLAGSKSENVKKLIDIFGKLSTTALDLAEAMTEVHKTTFQATFAVEGLGKTVAEQANIFKQFDEGLIKAQAATGLNVDELQGSYKSLYESTTYLAGGFGKAIDAAERTSQSMKLLSDSIVVARMTGMKFGETATYMNDLLESQGEAGEKSLRTISLLSKEIAGTGISTSAALGYIKSLSKSFEYLSFDSGEASDMIAGVIKTQEKLAESGVKAYKSPQQAARSYSEVLGKLASDQQDFAQSLFYTSVQGGNLEKALDFMFDASPAEAMAAKFKSVQDLFGGDLLTREEAKKSGRNEEFLAQASIAGGMLGLKSPQEYDAFLKVQKGGAPVEEALKQAGSREDRSATQLDAIKQANDKFYPNLMKQNEIQNKYLGQIGLHTATMADAMRRSAISGIQNTSAEIKGSSAFTAISDNLSNLKEQVKSKKNAIPYAPGFTPPATFEQQQRALNEKLEKEAPIEKATSMPTSPTTKAQTSSPTTFSTSSPIKVEAPKQNTFASSQGALTYSGDTSVKTGFLGQGSSTMWKRELAPAKSQAVYNFEEIEKNRTSSLASSTQSQKEIMRAKTDAASSAASASEKKETASQVASTNETYANINLSVNIDGKVVAEKTIPHLKVEFMPRNTLGQQTLAKG